MIEFRYGIPSEDAVRAHDGLWYIIDPGAHPQSAAVADLKVCKPGNTRNGDEDEQVCIRNGLTFYQPLANTDWAYRCKYSPCLNRQGKLTHWPEVGNE